MRSRSIACRGCTPSQKKSASETSSLIAGGIIEGGRRADKWAEFARVDDTLRIRYPETRNGRGGARALSRIVTVDGARVDVAVEVDDLVARLVALPRAGIVRGTALSRLVGVLQDTPLASLGDVLLREFRPIEPF